MLVNSRLGKQDFHVSHISHPFFQKPWLSLSRIVTEISSAHQPLLTSIFTKLDKAELTVSASRGPPLGIGFTQSKHVNIPKFTHEVSQRSSQSTQGKRRNALENKCHYAWIRGVVPFKVDKVSLWCMMAVVVTSGGKASGNVLHRLLQDKFWPKITWVS